MASLTPSSFTSSGSDKHSLSSIYTDYTTETEISALSSGSIAESSIPMDRTVAGKKIVEFLSEKVKASKYVIECREASFEARTVGALESPLFTVIEMKAEDFLRAKLTLRTWLLQIELHLERAALTESDQMKLKTSRLVIQDLLASVERKENYRRKEIIKSEFLLVAIDSSGGIQSICYAKRAHKPPHSPFEPDYSIEQIVTAPRNLKLSFQEKTVSGSATALIEEVAFRCLRHTGKKTLSLIAMDDARGFYEKLGFEPESEGSCRFSLSGEKLWEFVKTYGGIASTVITAKAIMLFCSLSHISHIFF